MTFFFVLLVLRREERPSMHLVWVKSVFWFVKYVDFYVVLWQIGSKHGVSTNVLLFDLGLLYHYYDVMSV